jgi:hypothetical protein
VLVIRALYPRLAPADAADIIVPHHQDRDEQAAGHAAGDGAPPRPAGRPPGWPTPHSPR